MMLPIEASASRPFGVGAEMSELSPRSASRTETRLSGKSAADAVVDSGLALLYVDVDRTTELRNNFTEHARALLDSGPWSLCWIGIFHRDWESLVFHCGLSQFNGTYASAALGLAESSATRLASRLAVDRGHPLALADTRNSADLPELKDLADRQSIGALLILPVLFGEHPGAVWLGIEKAREFTPAESAYAQYAATRFTEQWQQTYRTARLAEVVRAQSDQLDEFARLQSDEAQRQDHLEEVNRIHDALMPLVLNEQGLSALVGAAASLVDKPVLLFDRFDRLVAHSGLSETTLQSAEIGLGPHLRMYFDRDGARADFVTVGGQRFLIVPLFSERRTLGNLCFNFVEPPNNDAGTEIAEHVGLYFALELLKQRIRLDVQLRLSSDFFRSLLSDTGKSLQAVAERASLFGLDLARPSATLRVRITPAPTRDWYATLSATAWLLRAKLAEVGASAVVSPSSDSEIVIVVNADPAPLLREQVLPAVRATLDEILARHGGRRTLDIGVGTVGAGIEGIRASHDTAVRALALIDALGLHGTDLDITDFATYGLLLDIETPEQQRYVNRLLGPICQYDAQHSTELLKTLECYLECLGSVQRTASKLYLHPTTVRYRLARVEEVTGLHLDNSEHRLALSLALHLHRLSNPGPAD